MYTSNMTNGQLIFEATKIIDKHLQSSLSVNELSRKIGYSLFHFIRLFNGVVGCTPGEYFTARRLSQAARELLSNEKKIIEIALDYQFSSPEAFSRAFKKHSGKTPSAFRKSGDIKTDLSRLTWITPYYQDISSSNYKQVSREPEEVSLDEILLAGRIVEVKRDFSLIGKLWSDFIKLTPPGSAGVIPQYSQCSFWDEKREDDLLYVMVAFQVNKMSMNDTFVYKQIPSAKYLRFPHYGPEHRIVETYNWLFSSWLPETQFTLKLPYNLELYPPLDSNERSKGITAWILLPLEEI